VGVGTLIRAFFTGGSARREADIGLRARLGARVFSLDEGRGRQSSFFIGEVTKQHGPGAKALGREDRGGYSGLRKVDLKKQTDLLE